MAPSAAKYRVKYYPSTGFYQVEKRYSFLFFSFWICVGYEKTYSAAFDDLKKSIDRDRQAVAEKKKGPVYYDQFGHEVS